MHSPSLGDNGGLFPGEIGRGGPLENAATLAGHALDRRRSGKAGSLWLGGLVSREGILSRCEIQTIGRRVFLWMLAKRLNSAAPPKLQRAFTVETRSGEGANFLAGRLRHTFQNSSAVRGAEPGSDPRTLGLVDLFRARHVLFVLGRAVRAQKRITIFRIAERFCASGPCHRESAKEISKPQAVLDRLAANQSCRNRRQNYLLRQRDRSPRH